MPKYRFMIIDSWEVDDNTTSEMLPALVDELPMMSVYIFGAPPELASLVGEGHAFGDGWTNENSISYLEQLP